MNRNQRIEQQANAIEAELKQLGYWQSSPLPDAAFDGQAAFFSDTMSLPQWLQFVFLPRIREILSTNGDWPNGSQVGAYAAQQFLFYRPVPGKPDALETQGGGDGREIRLVQLLQQFDAMFAPERPEK